MAQIVVTPVLTVVRYNLTKPDTPTKLPDGKVVGGDRYQLVGFFDPQSADGKAFIDKAVAAVEAAGNKKARDCVLFNMPENRELPKPMAEIPEHYRRISTRSKYGPVETVDKTGRAVDGDTVLFPGALARAAVAFYVFDDVRQHNKKSVAFRLQTVLVLPGGKRLSIGARVDATRVFASFLGETTSIDPFADEALS